MRALVQRVSRCSVRVNGKVISSTGKGLLVLLGITHDDGEKETAYIVDKVLNLRIFDDDDGKMNLSIMDVGGELMVVLAAWKGPIGPVTSSRKTTLSLWPKRPLAKVSHSKTYSLPADLRVHHSSDPSSPPTVSVMTSLNGVSSGARWKRARDSTGR